MYAEDNREIATLFIEIIKDNFPDFDVIHVENGRKAIDYLQSDIFDLVISDYTMPENTGGDVLNYMLDNDREEPFILITGERIKLLPEFKGKTPTDKMKFLNKPVDEDVLVEIIARMLNIVGKEMEPEKNNIEGDDYVPIEITRIGNFNTAPCDFYLSLSQNKMVKVINKGGIEVQDIINKYEPKGVKSLYIIKSDLQIMNEAITERLGRVMDSGEDLSSASRMALEGDAVLTIQEQLQNFGVKDDYINYANKVVDHVIDTYKTDKNINEMINLIKNSTDGYLIQHSMMTSFMANIIIKNSEWSSVTNQEKITMASLFHDISLANSSYEDEETKSFLTGINENETEKDFLNHPQKSVEMLSKIPNMPDLFTIILEHHEKPDGSGFPRGLKANRLSPMSCILILAHHLADLIQFNQGEYKINNEMIESLREKYNDGHFLQLIECFKSALNPF